MIFRDISLTESNRRMPPAGWMPAAFVLLFVLSAGCAVTQGTGRVPVEGFDMNRAVKNSDRRLNELSGRGEVISPVRVGKAMTILAEMKHFQKRRKKEEVRRLESEMKAVLNGLSSDIKAAEKSGISGLKAEVIRLKEENARARRDLRASRRTRKIEARAYRESIEAVSKARDEAIREVVRARSRIQGMASSAEAAAMFAEARVIIDRMTEEAYSFRSREYLEEGSDYLRDGRRELDGKNPGGAAYLFDLISTLYQNFRASDPRKLTVVAKSAILRASSTTKSGKITTLALGDVLYGLGRSEDWFRVRTDSEGEGWIRADLVR